MNEKENRAIVPRDVLAKTGISAVSYLAGGIYVLVMTAGSRGLLGIILPVAALAVGIGAILSRDQDDKKPGFFITAAGVLGMLTRFVPAIRPLGGTVLGIGAFALIALGIWKGIKFFFGLKSRQ